MCCIEFAGWVMMVAGVIGLLWAMFIMPADPAVCPVCQEVELEGAEEVCPGCDTFIKSLSHCEKHDIIFDGVDCPKCTFGIFAKKR